MITDGPPGHAAQVDVAAVVVDDASVCTADLDDALFVDGPLPAVLDAELDLAEPPSPVAADTVCLWNRGRRDVAVTLSMVHVVAVEVGPCPPSEREAGDRTCADGDVGELELAVTSDSVGCVVTDDGRTVVVRRARCAVQVSAWPTFTVAAAAQTDRVRFDLVWVAERCSRPGCR